MKTSLSKCNRDLRQDSSKVHLKYTVGSNQNDEKFDYINIIDDIICDIKHNLVVKLQ